MGLGFPSFSPAFLFSLERQCLLARKEVLKGVAAALLALGSPLTCGWSPKPEEGRQEIPGEKLGHSTLLAAEAAQG